MKPCSAFEITETKYGITIIRILNAQPVKIPHSKSILTSKQARDPILFLHVHIMNVNYAKFQKKFDSRTISRELP